MESRCQSAATPPPWAYRAESAGVGLLERAGIESLFLREYPSRRPQDVDEGPYWLFASALDRF